MSQTLRILLTSEDLELQLRLEAAVEGLATVSSVNPTAANLLQSLVESKPALLLVDLNAHIPLHAIVALVRRADPSLQTIAVGDARNPDAVLGAVRAGATDFLDRGEPADVLRAQIIRHIKAVGEAYRASPGAFELVLSPQPGSGDSLFAINLAAMRAKASKEMLLIDCTLPCSEAGAALDLKLSYTVQDAIKDVTRLDRTLASSALARHEETGLSVLPLATQSVQDVDNVAPEALARLVSTIRPLFRDTILAAGAVRSPGLLLEFMQAATRIYFVCQQKFTAVADGQRLLERIAPGPEVYERTILVIDEYQSGITLTEEQMRSTLSLPRSVRLPHSRVDLINGLNTGRPLALDQPRGAYAAALMRLSEEGGPVRAAQAGPGRLFTEALTKAARRISKG